MLMLTHTWILRELLDLAGLEVTTPDIFVYNVCPDILPIHRSVHSSMTHRIPRFMKVPPEFRKAHYVQIHLLADDIAHHGRICEEVVTEFNPDATGYTYVMGKSLVDPIMDYCARFGCAVNRLEAIYRSHMIVELSIDVYLRETAAGNGLIDLFQDAMAKTDRYYMPEFTKTLSWLFGVEESVIREAMNHAMDFYTLEKMIRFTKGDERVPRYVRIFGADDANESACAGMEELMDQGMSLIGDPTAYLHGVVRAIRESPYCGILQGLGDKAGT
ncbi:MAG: hypothetical protein WCX84_02055 [Syntrophales bacterium]|jgi:hypothetical protein|nr:hypothetical protein [Syntrophales bacterium]